jgi:hypothetical protein
MIGGRNSNCQCKAGAGQKELEAHRRTISQSLTSDDTASGTGPMRSADQWRSAKWAHSVGRRRNGLEQLPQRGFFRCSQHVPDQQHRSHWCRNADSPNHGHHFRIFWSDRRSPENYRNTEQHNQASPLERPASMGIYMRLSATSGAPPMFP